MKNGKKIIALVIVVLVVALMGFAYITFSPKTSAGAKNVTIEVINSKQESTVYEVNTDAEFLEQAIEEADGLELQGYEGPYGFTIEAVNGETAIYEKDGAYWSIMVNGDYGNYGISEQPIADGDAFQLIWTKA